MGAGSHTLGANLGPGNQGPVQSRSEALGLQGRGGTQTCGRGEEEASGPCRETGSSGILESLLGLKDSCAPHSRR